MKKNIWFFDTEVYPNYFSIGLRNKHTREIRSFEIFNDIASGDISKLKYMLLDKSNLFISFNGLNYDIPILCGVLGGYSNREIYEISLDIIENKKPGWIAVKDRPELNTINPNHIDVFPIPKGKASLKIYAGRLNAKKLQSLPHDPHKCINNEQRLELIKYRDNDLNCLELLYEELIPQIKLRIHMTDILPGFPKDQLFAISSQSDAQLAETSIRYLIEHKYKKKLSRPEYKDNETYKYYVPDFIKFSAPCRSSDYNLRSLPKFISQLDFELGGNGRIMLPQQLKDQDINIGDSRYQMGIGGLHSTEKSRFIKSTETHQIIDLDVTSYYPYIILNQNISPPGAKGAFVDVYRGVVNTRVKAKQDGHKTTADTLKIVVNSIFGKMGNKYSIFYAPQLLIQVTITGQLALLMLIERFERAGIPCISANTDGVTIYCPVDKMREALKVAFDWQKATGFNLEQQYYDLLASRDVNNYFAVTDDGKLKCKGAFADPGIDKNPQFPIIYDAVKQLFIDGLSIEDTIYGCQDITRFLKLIKVTGGAKWRDEELGNAVRFYYSKDVTEDEAIRYCLNGNKVSQSARGKPLMNLPDELPKDIDYDNYINMAKDALKDIGYEFYT